MNAPVVIPLHPIPSGVNSPQTLPHTSSPNTSRSAVTSTLPPNFSQAANSTNQAKPKILAAGTSLSTSLCSCTLWIKSHPLLSIGGLIVGLITLLFGISSGSGSLGGKSHCWDRAGLHKIPDLVPKSQRRFPPYLILCQTNTDRIRESEPVELYLVSETSYPGYV
jgi:hypothetical protein